MITSDFHVHTSFSPDSDATPKAMIERAIKLGLEVICFTDHEDKENFVLGFECVIEMQDYIATLQEVRERYRDEIDVRIGIELGILPHLGETYDDFVGAYPFDFVIGSVHTACGEDLHIGNHFTNHPDEEAYRLALHEALVDIKATKSMNVLGHLDHMIRYGTNKERDFSYARFAEEIDAILITLIESGRGIEVNTSASRYGVGLWHPHTDIIRRYRALGGEIITVGSDSHVPEHLMWEFRAVEDMLIDCGFTHYTEFKDREPVFKKLR